MCYLLTRVYSMRLTIAGEVLGKNVRWLCILLS
jgi:hypothetical protein